MAKPPATDAEKKSRKKNSVLVWVLMAMLIAGLGGFGVTNFGGGVTTIATVGERDITVNDYARALQQEMQAFGAQVGQPVTLEQAQALGLDRQVRQRLITAAALDNEAQRVGLSVGDARVAQEIMADARLQGRRRPVRPRDLSLHAGPQQPDRARVRDAGARRPGALAVARRGGGRLRRACRRCSTRFRPGWASGAASACCG